MNYRVWGCLYQNWYQYRYCAAPYRYWQIAHLGTYTSMLIPINIMRTTSLCKNKRSEICFFRHFCIWESPYANFLSAKCVQIPICESPYANKYCSNAPKMNFLRIWDPRTHNEIVRIWGLTSMSMLEAIIWILLQYAYCDAQYAYCRKF